MKTTNYQYQTPEALISFIAQENFKSTSYLFIQIFTGVCEVLFIENLLKLLTNHLPQAKIIGATTDGEIIQGKILEKQTVISFSDFNHTIITTYLTDFIENSYQTGIALMQQMENVKQAKLLITFSQGLTINGEEYVKGIQNQAPSLPIAGGLASDNAQFIATYVFTEKGIVKKGAVGALFFGKTLFINRYFNFSWEPIGQELTITKSIKNRVYTIDNMTAERIYTKYLGSQISNLLPATGIEFPLVIQKKGLTIARAVLNKYEDGSLLFAGNIAEGEKVRFAYGNVDAILEQAPICSTHISQAPVESIFIYSCMARKRLLSKDIEIELQPLSDLAPTIGFFTNGEFFHNQGQENELLNQTMTIVTLSESSTIQFPQLTSKIKPSIDKSLTVSALSHLISVTSTELHNLNEKLEFRVQQKTAQLSLLNKQLENRIEQKSLEIKAQYEKLHETEKQLIKNEKFASLGTLVAGIAHEINTPIGLSLTGITYLKDELKGLKKAHETEQMTEDLFQEFLYHSAKMMQSIHTSLDKTVILVKSFKQIAVDQSSDEYRTFNLAQYIDEILLSLHNMTRFIKHNMIVDIDKKIVLKSKPGALSQVITNLITNSLTHAFDESIENPEMIIKATQSNQILTLIFSDNGIGMNKEVKRQIFDPFFTTKRGSGGSGLGMNIIYNIITQSFKGTIEIESSLGKGAQFCIKIPI